MTELNIEADRAHILSEGLCKQLIARFHRRRRAGQREGAILHELLHETYAQGFAAAVRATPPSPSTAEVDERAAFEAWAQGRVTSLIQGKFGTGYVYADAARAWQAWQARAALASRPAVEAGELPPLPTLPRDLLTMIGEYGMARTETVGQLEVQHRWELLIGGIKQYASDYARAALATKPATSAPGAADGDRAALEVSFRAGIQQARATLCGEPSSEPAAQREA